MRLRASILSVAALLALPAAARAQDPVRTDPPAGGPHPPAMDELRIPSGGARMNGLVYLAAGEGAHPTAVFLHGYPGNERNLDLAQAVRRAGWNAVYFDYRGSWGSGGTFSYPHALDDVAAALAFLRAPATASKYHVDASRIALVGHSFGGGLALLAEARDPGVACAVSIAGYNAGAAGRTPAAGEALLGYFRDTMDPDAGPIRGNPEAAIAEIRRNAAAWDLAGLGPALRNRPVLLVAGTRDPDNNATRRAVADALRAAGSTAVRTEEWNTDHSFSDRRLALADLVVGWLGASCPAVAR